MKTPPSKGSRRHLVSPNHRVKAVLEDDDLTTPSSASSQHVRLHMKDRKTYRDNVMYTTASERKKITDFFKKFPPGFHKYNEILKEFGYSSMAYESIKELHENYENAKKAHLISVSQKLFSCNDNFSGEVVINGMSKDPTVSQSLATLVTPEKSNISSTKTSMSAYSIPAHIKDNDDIDDEIVDYFNYDDTIVEIDRSHEVSTGSSVTPLGVTREACTEEPLPVENMYASRTMKALLDAVIKIRDDHSSCASLVSAPVSAASLTSSPVTSKAITVLGQAPSLDAAVENRASSSFFSTLAPTLALTDSVVLNPTPVASDTFTVPVSAPVLSAVVENRASRSSRSTLVPTLAPTALTPTPVTPKGITVPVSAPVLSAVVENRASRSSRSTLVPTSAPPALTPTPVTPKGITVPVSAPVLSAVVENRASRSSRSASVSALASTLASTLAPVTATAPATAPAPATASASALVPALSKDKRMRAWTSRNGNIEESAASRTTRCLPPLATNDVSDKEYPGEYFDDNIDTDILIEENCHFVKRKKESPKVSLQDSPLKKKAKVSSALDNTCTLKTTEPTTVIPSPSGINELITPNIKVRPFDLKQSVAKDATLSNKMQTQALSRVTSLSSILSSRDKVDTGKRELTNLSAAKKNISLASKNSIPHVQVTSQNLQTNHNLENATSAMLSPYEKNEPAESVSVLSNWILKPISSFFTSIWSIPTPPAQDKNDVRPATITSVSTTTIKKAKRARSQSVVTKRSTKRFSLTHKSGEPKKINVRRENGILPQPSGFLGWLASIFNFGSMIGSNQNE